MRYLTSNADQYIAITGAGVKDVKIVKSAMVWPFQTSQRFSIQPLDYAIDLQAMTKEKLQVLVPVVFTIGPHVDELKNVLPEHLQQETLLGNEERQADENEDIHVAIGNAPEYGGDALKKYAMLLANNSGKDKGIRNKHIEDIVKGIIEGETRVLVSCMTMEEIFSQRDVFKKRILTGIATELSQFGLKIYNANVKELRDAPGSNYFETLSRKAHEGAVNRAKVDVAEARKAGTVGEELRNGERDRELAKINAETQVAKTERDTERAQAEAKLKQNTIDFNRQTEIKRIEATRQTESRDEELRKGVEVMRAQTELERLRASDVVKATILREAKEQSALAEKYQANAKADASQYTERVNADAHAYAVEAEAAASFKAKQQTVQAEKFEQETRAQAAFFAAQKAADAAAYKVEQEAAAAIKKAEADFITQKRKAEGLSAMASAYSDLSHAFGGPAGLIQYLMIERGVYQDLATANANAVKGMAPKMTIWNTGNEAGSDGSGNGANGLGGINSIRNIYQSLPPLMTTINEQTGVVLPEWQFGRLGEQLSEREISGKPIKGMSNGSK